MAGKSSHAIAIEVIDLCQLCQVRGGDKQTDAAQTAIAQATAAVEDLDRTLAPKPAGMTDMLMQMLGRRRSGPGPSSAPALPPTSTLTR